MARDEGIQFPGRRLITVQDAYDTHDVSVLGVDLIVLVDRASTIEGRRYATLPPARPDRETRYLTSISRLWLTATPGWLQFDRYEGSRTAIRRSRGAL
jgi:hypothetical protein